MSLIRNSFLIICFLLYPSSAFGYLDPGSGSALVTVALSIAGAALFYIKSIYYRIFKKTNSASDLNQTNTIVLFSEGKTYWGTFRPLIRELIRRKTYFRFITLDLYDPALEISSPYMNAKLLPAGSETFYALAQISTPVMLTTTPNIGCEGYSLKRSPNVGKLVHVFHSVDPAGNYRLGSLDHYDSVILSGAFQKSSIRMIEKARNIPKKDCVVLGLPYLDDLFENTANPPVSKTKEEKTTILIAPSWGKKGCFNEYGWDFVRNLADHGYNIIVRLHPHSYTYEKDMVRQIESCLSQYPNIAFDREVLGSRTMEKSDILISDTSSIRLDYCFLYFKPVITLEVAEKSRYEFESIYLSENWSDQISDVIGKKLDKNSLHQIPIWIKKLTQQNLTPIFTNLRNDTIANFGSSARPIIDYIDRLRLDQIKETVIDD